MLHAETAASFEENPIDFEQSTCTFLRSFIAQAVQGNKEYHACHIVLVDTCTCVYVQAHA